MYKKFEIYGALKKTPSEKVEIKVPLHILNPSEPTHQIINNHIKKMLKNHKLETNEDWTKKVEVPDKNCSFLIINNCKMFYIESEEAFITYMAILKMFKAKNLFTYEESGRITDFMSAFAYFKEHFEGKFFLFKFNFQENSLDVALTHKQSGKNFFYYLNHTIIPKKSLNARFNKPNLDYEVVFNQTILINKEFTQFFNQIKRLNAKINDFDMKKEKEFFSLLTELDVEIEREMSFVLNEHNNIVRHFHANKDFNPVYIEYDIVTSNIEVCYISGNEIFNSQLPSFESDNKLSYTTETVKQYSYKVNKFLFSDLQLVESSLVFKPNFFELINNIKSSSNEFLKITFNSIEESKIPDELLALQKKIMKENNLFNKREVDLFINVLINLLKDGHTEIIIYNTGEA